MNNYRLFDYENIKPDADVKSYYNINNINSTNNMLSELDKIKPIDNIPDVLHRDDFMEQDIEIDISSNRFREIWNKYENEYNSKNNDDSMNNVKKYESFSDSKVLSEGIDEFYLKAKEFNDYLTKIIEMKKESEEAWQLLDLSKKELEQEKELFNIEKDKFDQYKKEEINKLNKDKIKFQNMVEEIKNKIDTVLSK